MLPSYPSSCGCVCLQRFVGDLVETCSRIRMQTPTFTRDLQTACKSAAGAGANPVSALKFGNLPPPWCTERASRRCSAVLKRQCAHGPCSLRLLHHHSWHGALGRRTHSRRLQPTLSMSCSDPPSRPTSMGSGRCPMTQPTAAQEADAVCFSRASRSLRVSSRSPGRP